MSSKLGASLYLNSPRGVALGSSITIRCSHTVAGYSPAATAEQPLLEPENWSATLLVNMTGHAEREARFKSAVSEVQREFDLK